MADTSEAVCQIAPIRDVVGAVAGPSRIGLATVIFQKRLFQRRASVARQAMDIALGKLCDKFDSDDDDFAYIRVTQIGRRKMMVTISLFYQIILHSYAQQPDAPLEAWKGDQWIDGRFVRRDSPLDTMFRDALDRLRE